MINNSTGFRLYVRIGCFLLAAILLLPFPFWVDTSRIFVQTSSFVTICSLLAGGTIWVGSVLGLGFSIIALIRKRWFCRYICPVGLILDTASGIKLPFKIWWKGCPSIGKYIALLTAAGAIFGYPLFLWMDPLALLNNAFSVYKASESISVIIFLSGIIILILLALTSGSFWCARLCPLGATQDLLENVGSYCRNISNSEKKESEEKTSQGYSLPATRRTFIAVAAGIGLSLWAQKTGQARSKDTTLRPPGAIEEDEFTGLCIRCGNCTRACPSGIIHPDAGKAGILGLLAPVVRYEKNYCNEECNACTKACPSGALQNLTLEQKNRYVIGKASVDTSLCLWGFSDCNTCIRACPYEAVKVQWYEEAYESFPGVDPLKCNGCGACEVVCPTGDLKAIKVRKNID
jgi:ferredoxin-type protein NapF